jgi:hypothetical protein
VVSGIQLQSFSKTQLWQNTTWHRSTVIPAQTSFGRVELGLASSLLSASLYRGDDVISMRGKWCL